MPKQDDIIQRLVDVLNAYEGKQPLISCQGQAMDGYSALANFIKIAQDARKAMMDKSLETSSESHPVDGNISTQQLTLSQPEDANQSDTIGIHYVSERPWG